MNETLLAPRVPSWWCLTVIIPCYNEQEIIGDTLAEMATALQLLGHPYEIVVVDDGSMDDSCARVRQAAEPLPNGSVRLYELPRHLGKGMAVRHGLQVASGDIIVIMDADLPYRLEVIRMMLAAHAAGASLVCGSRLLADGAIASAVPAGRRLLGSMLRHITGWLFFGEPIDTQCGCKSMRRATARRLARELTIDGFAYDIELILLVRQCWRERVAFVPVSARPTRRASHIRLWHAAPRFMADLVRLAVAKRC